MIRMPFTRFNRVDSLAPVRRRTFVESTIRGALVLLLGALASAPGPSSAASIQTFEVNGQAVQVHVPDPVPPQFSADGRTAYYAVPPQIFIQDPSAPLSPTRIPSPAMQGAPDINLLGTASFTIDYVAAGGTDLWGAACQSFPTTAKTVFNAAAAIWSNLLTSSVPITIRACWSNLGSTSTLGYSGGGSLQKDFTGAPMSGTWYSSALANSLHGSDLASSSYDMHITYNSNFTWYLGTDGNTPGGQMDLMSVVLHEIGHGLNFSGTATVSGGVGSWGQGGYPSIYERYMYAGSGTPLLNTSVYPNNSTALASLLQSDSLYFRGPNAMAANAGQPVKMYAPSTWKPGSSYAHLDYGTFSGTSNRLMVYAISSGTATHDPGPITLGLLKDLGWPEGSTATAPAVTTSAASGVGQTGATLNGTVSSNGAGTTVTFQYGTTTGYGSTATATQSPLAATAAGAAVSATVSGLACGTLYHYRAVGSNSAGTANGYDQTFTTTACSAAQPDLVVTNLQSATSGTAGGTLNSVSATVANQGSASAGAFRIGFYFSTDAAITTADTFTGSYCTSTGLAAGLTATCTTNVSIPASLTTGAYYFGAIVDYQSAVVEGNEGNNGRAADTGKVTVTGVAGTPSVTTNAASGVGRTAATLNGTVSSNGASTTVTFQYGTTTGYGSTATATQSPLAASASGAAVSATISGLTCNTLYHYRVVGTNSAGTANGSDATFTTAACTSSDDNFPAGGAIPAGWRTSTGANAGWQVAADSTNLGPYSLKSAAIGDNQTAAIEVTGNYAAGNVTFSVRVSSEADYDYFRFYVDGVQTLYGSGEVAWQSVSVPITAGTHTFTWAYEKDELVSSGADAAWIDTVVFPASSGGSVPSVATSAAAGVGQTGATLNGTVSSNGASTTVTFQYGTTTGYGSTATATQSPLASTASNTAVSATISGLTCNTLYHYRVVGTNSTGTANGSDATFTTAACSASQPSVVTNAASGVGRTGATLRGTVSSNGASTTVTFQYGTTTGYGSTATATQSPLASTASSTAVSATVSGLTCNTLYHYRVVATNSAGTANGADSTFTTSSCASSDDNFPAGGAVPAGWRTSTGASAGWRVTTDSTNLGSYSLKSAAIGDNQTAAIEVTGNYAAGNVTFSVRVSSEADYDYFSFYVDGVLWLWGSGEVPWQSVSVPVTAGTHTFTWAYEKDELVSSGADAAWIDTVVLPASAGASATLTVQARGTGIGLVTSSPAGINCGSTCSASYVAGTTVTLTAANPWPGSAFANWSGACSGSGMCTLIASGAQQATANFVYTGSAYSYDYVQKAYIAYYGRPADPPGQAYWAGQMDAAGRSLATIIGAFGNSDEFNQRYGGLTNTQLVTKVYQQALGRDPDAAGLAWYVGELNAGRKTLQSITLDVINGATAAPDSTVVANKLDVAAYYTAKVAAGCAYGTEQDGVTVISTVGASASSVTSAKAAINTKCGI